MLGNLHPKYRSRYSSIQLVSIEAYHNVLHEVLKPFMCQMCILIGFHVYYFVCRKTVGLLWLTAWNVLIVVQLQLYLPIIQPAIA